ncbi:glycosyl hydrolase family 88 [Parahaliea maris]|uniref:Glycosyl hydrolase family 88 n=2 Tax=Parahaliea maris TaxID=2716870 RepID=A0A5C9ABM9_9GAMM|nr:glycosyl hydrolase family 88 [Parahaliea maris]
MLPWTITAAPGPMDSATGAEPAAAALSWATRLADSTMQRSPQAWAMRPHKGLTQPSWGYTYGLALLGFERLYQRTGRQEYLDYTKTYVDQLIDAEGRIQGYRTWDYNIDSINAGKLLFLLYEQTGDERYRTAMQTLRNQFDWHPRTGEGGLWHKLIYPWQMWLDGLYMGAAYYAQYSAVFDEPPASFDDIAHQFTLIEQKTRDPESGLLYHGWDESRVQPWSDSDTGLSQEFWSRGMGWYAMALVDSIEHFPADHPGRGQLLEILQRLVKAVVSVQHTSGLWYQVLDQGDRAGNYLEASGSAMFTYAIARGVNRGYLDRDLAPVARRAFDGLVKQLVKLDPTSGEVTLTGICGSAGLGGNPYRPGTFDYYISEPQVDNDPHGVGPFILAALEIERL